MKKAFFRVHAQLESLWSPSSPSATTFVLSSTFSSAAAVDDFQLPHFSFYSQRVRSIFTHPVFYTSRSFSSTRGRLRRGRQSRILDSPPTPHPPGAPPPTFCTRSTLRAGFASGTATCDATRAKGATPTKFGAGAGAEKGNARADLNVCDAPALDEFSHRAKMSKNYKKKSGKCNTTPVEPGITV